MVGPADMTTEHDMAVKPLLAPVHATNPRSPAWVRWCCMRTHATTRALARGPYLVIENLSSHRMGMLGKQEHPPHRYHLHAHNYTERPVNYEFHQHLKDRKVTDDHDGRNTTGHTRPSPEGTPSPLICVSKIAPAQSCNPKEPPNLPTGWRPCLQKM